MYLWVGVLLAVAVSASSAFYVDPEDEWSSYFSRTFRQGDGSFPGAVKAEKRYSISPSCRSCAQRPGDWSACALCYNRPGGSVPFFGFEKRSAEGLSQQEGGNGEDSSLEELQQSVGDIEKRSIHFACKCCMHTHSQYCCAKCDVTPYYRRQSPPASYKKRSYQPSFFSVGPYGSSMCEQCCSHENFDFYCCIGSCSKRK